MKKALRTAAPFVACAFVLARVLGACTVDDLSLTGKQCPCATGYVCDVPSNTCVLGLSGAPNPTTDGGDNNRTDAPVGGFVVQRFVATWQTSRSIRWDFDVAGDASEFAEYQLIVGGSEDAVRRQDSSTALFDRRINPELGSFGGRDIVAAGAVARAWTVTDKHAPAKTVFARLIVRDKAGRENASNVISVDTVAESHALVLFGDQVLDGSAPTPTDLKRVANDCYATTAGCLQIAKIGCPVVDAAAADAGDGGACDFEIGIESFDKTVTANSITQADFGKAFVELAVRGGPGASPKPQSDLILTIGAPACRIDGQKCRFRWTGGWSFRPGTKEFRLIQVPLSALLLETASGAPGQALKYDDFAINSLRIEAITIDGMWTSGANIGLDQATIRW